MTDFKAKTGDRVRVVRCMLGHANHVGLVGDVEAIAANGVYDVDLENGDGCAAAEVAPVWVVGKPVTAEMGELPIGARVRVGSETACKNPDGWWGGGVFIDGTDEDMMSSSYWEDHGPEISFVLVSLPGAQTTTGCSGSGTCSARLHVHGCYADEGECDEPGEHAELKSAPTRQPQTREVPLREVRDGDTVTVEFKAHASNSEQRDGLWLSDFAGGWEVPSMFLATKGIAVTREIEPLPTRIGSVGVATVRGVPGVRVARTYELAALPWLSFQAADNNFRHADGDITDYEPLLDGEVS